jgi:hypothetical protein
VKTFAILLLSIASLAVLAALILFASIIILGLAIDVPDGWPRHVVVYVLVHPGLSLVTGLLLLGAFGRIIWRLAH